MMSDFGRQLFAFTVKTQTSIYAKILQNLL